MKKTVFICLLTLFAGSLFSQINQGKFSISHPLTSKVENSYKPRNFVFTADTLTVVAVLVQFQEDNSPYSTGNGKFDLSNKYYNTSLQRDTVVDSPPYDSAYFVDHLLFLQNYYYKASKGKLVIKYDLYGKVLTLPHDMQYYSPQQNENNAKLGQLFTDSWTIADSSINFSLYNPDKTAFVLFHAGVGRDIDLSSVYGYDPTPYDIPSVYLGLKSLREFYGNNYNGFQTSEGLFIKNSLIIPSTELREISSFGNTFLLQLGINGILTGSFGSFLGLPDLFNTVTGKTAIGRFGLMDGQSIFSFNGIFPPEPSAWEKIYLGWVEPLTVSYGDNLYSLKTSSLPEPADTSIIKVLINSREYFLLENRNRNPYNQGQKVYTRNRSFRDSVLYTKDVPGFVYYDIYQVNGNLYDVSYLDWSLPGSIDDTSNFRGGILIWHIDENVIDANFASNTINNNISHKGVNLKEAKGSQDIGVTFSTPFGNVTADGSFVDFWYNGQHYVPATIYKNQFTPTSIPSSLSYSLTNNRISITNFDTISTIMSFRIKIGSDVMSPVPGYPKKLGAFSNTQFNQVIPIDINNDTRDELFANNGKDLYAFRNNGTGLINASGLLLSNYGYFPSVYCYVPYLNDYRLAAFNNGQSSSSLGMFKINQSSISDTSITPFSYVISTPSVVFDSSRLVIGFANGFVYEKSLNANQGQFTDTSKPGTVNRFTKDNNSFRTARGTNLNIISGNFSDKTSFDSLLQTSISEVNINGKGINKYGINFSNIIAADINKDGKQEVIFTYNNFIYAVNSNGILLDNFPLKSNFNITSGISVADVNDDGIFDVIYVNSNGDLNAVGINGKSVDGFPYMIGPGTVSTPAVFNYSDTLAIAVLSADGYLYAFRTNKVYKPENVLWKNYLRDRNLSNNNFRGISAPNAYSEKLPKDKVYNWPNPVYDNVTYIRYYINGSSSGVTVRIMDLSGELVAKLTGTANPNAENEVAWNVSGVQSGIYYGVVEANIDGSTETKIIKIAVVK